MKMAVGLGNPGRQYARTRHNAGWMVLDRFASKHGAEFRATGRAPAETARVSLEGAGNLLLVKPMTYMNCSGEVLPALMRPAGIEARDVVVVVDDVHLPAGKLRIRAQGSAGGHNGLKSVIEHLGTDAFTRIRVGVGEKAEGEDLADHVLETLKADDYAVLAEASERACDALEAVLTDGVDAAMNRYNGEGDKQ